MSRLAAERLSAAYPGRSVLHEVDLVVPDGVLSVVVGPNACGKSTLLRALARMHRPTAGRAVLDGRETAQWPARELARVLGVLPQSPTAPESMVVEDLVARGRYPHQGLLRQWSERDEEAVDRALRSAGVLELGRRPVDELSGGQRQRVWLAMVLAQETDLLLLDEPTTYLDLPHQLEVLDLVRRMVREQQRTVVAVLHDLHLAFRYADHLVVMADGVVVATGPPSEVVTAELVEHVYAMPCRIITDPVSGTPLVIPEERR